MTDKDKFYLALSVVYFEACEQAEFHKKKMSEKPPKGWLKVDYHNYHNDKMVRANQASEWCFFQRMKINPD